MNDQNFISENIVNWLLFYLAGALIIALLYISVPRASLQVSNQPKGKYVTVDRVSLAKPGFVVLLRPTEELGYGEFIGNSEYLLPGVYEDMNISMSNPDSESPDSVRVMINVDNGNKFLESDEEYARNLFGKVVRKLINLH